jgi:hypothetical protein
MGYLNFWHALTYRNATAKKATVNKSITASCIQDLPSRADDPALPRDGTNRPD